MFNSNGFIVVDTETFLNGKRYAGVDTGVWPANNIAAVFSKDECDEFESLTESLEVGSHGASLITLNLMRKYCYCCEKENIPYRTLYLETTATSPKFDEEVHRLYGKKTNFLGYDVAFCNDDLYSSVLNDIIYRPCLFPVDYQKQLNENGLFENYADADNYMRERNTVDCNNGEFEIGVFRLIAVYSV